MKKEYISVDKSDVSKFTPQSFSSSDLNKDPENTGIVYPLTEAENQPSFSSIVAHRDGRTILVNGEYRLVDLRGEAIHYSKGRCLNYIRAKEKIVDVSLCESAFGESKEGCPQSYILSDGVKIDNVMANHILTMFNNLEWTPSTEFISDKNLSKKESSYSRFYLV